MSKVLQITAKQGNQEGARVTTVSVNTGGTVEESIKMFGGDAVNSNANANWTVTIQSGIRRLQKAGKSEDEIQDVFKGVKMGVAIARVSDPTSALIAKWPTLPEAEKADILKKLKASEKK